VCGAKGRCQFHQRDDRLFRVGFEYVLFQLGELDVGTVHTRQDARDGKGMDLGDLVQAHRDAVTPRVNQIPLPLDDLQVVGSALQRENGWYAATGKGFRYGF